MRCIVYTRVSTEEQVRHGFSLAAQEEDCRKRARQLGYRDPEVEVLREEGVSGEAVDRPGLNRLRDQVAAGGVGHVVMYDPDRFARNLSLQLIVTDEILRAGTQLEFVNFEWRDTAEGRLFYSLRGAIAEYEKAKIKERTRRGRERMVKEGQLPCDPHLFGYRWNTADRRFEQHPAEFPILQHLKDLALAGQSPHGIGRALAAAGVPAPRGERWYPSTVWKMLRNADYTGLYRTGKRGGYARLLPLEPAWSEEVRERLVTLLARGRSGGWTRGARQSNGPSLLTGLLYCGECGGGTRMASRRTGRYRYYSCNRKARVAYGPGSVRVTGCEGGYWPAAKTEAAVWEAVVPLLGSLPPPTAGTPQDTAVWQLAVAAANRREQRLLRLYLSGRIDEQAYDSELQKLRSARTVAERQLGQPETNTDVAIQSNQEGLGALIPAQRRTLLCQVVDRIVAGPGPTLWVHTPLLAPS